MRLLRSRQILPVLTGLVFLAGSCSSAPESDSDAGLRSAVATTLPSTTTTAAATTTTTTLVETTTTSTTGVPRPASAEAIAFASLAPDAAGMTDGALDFLDGIDPARIDELAATSCDAVQPSMSPAALGVEGFNSYDNLSIDEQAKLELSDWVLLFGALLGFFCPLNLPELDLEATPIDGTDVEQFRDIVTEVSGVSAESTAFIAAATDDRINELQTSACATTSADLSVFEFGVVILQSYLNDLTAIEQEAIGQSAYSELYGAILGWFCPESLPR